MPAEMLIFVLIYLRLVIDCKSFEEIGGGDRNRTDE